MSKKTTLNAKCEILADVWLNYRDDEEYTDFISYCDLGLPLAYAVHSGIILITDRAVPFIEESFELLLSLLDIEDEGFETFEDILDVAE